MKVWGGHYKSLFLPASPQTKESYICISTTTLRYNTTIPYNTSHHENQHPPLCSPEPLLHCAWLKLAWLVLLYQQVEVRGQRDLGSVSIAVLFQRSLDEGRGLLQEWQILPARACSTLRVSSP